jgi:hypothetical protein
MIVRRERQNARRPLNMIGPYTSMVISETFIMRELR